MDLSGLSGHRLSQLQGLALLACLIITFLAAATVCLCAERPLPRGAVGLRPAAAEGGGAPQRLLCGLWRTFDRFPPLLKMVFAAQFLTSLGKNGTIEPAPTQPLCWHPPPPSPSVSNRRPKRDQNEEGAASAD